MSDNVVFGRVDFCSAASTDAVISFDRADWQRMDGTLVLAEHDAPIALRRWGEPPKVLGDRVRVEMSNVPSEYRGLLGRLVPFRVPARPVPPTIVEMVADEPESIGSIAPVAPVVDEPAPYRARSKRRASK